MKIAILGFAGQGESAFHYWDTPDNDITICDAKTDLKVPDGVTAILGPDYLTDLDQFDVLIRTPALHPKDIVAANPDAPNILDKVWSNTNEFLRVCPTKNIIGVTGTKGKGTTSTLITRMLDAAGFRVHLGGNIGIPPLDMLANNIQPEDWVVLELANFQLIDLENSPHIALCLMVVPEHMDWHNDVNEYITAKQQLFKHQTNDDLAIFYAANEHSQKIVQASYGQKIPYMEAPGAVVVDDKIMIDGVEVCSLDDIKLIGKHNWQNICAAVTAVWQITPDPEAIRSVLMNFSGLEHRLEFVRELDGVKYYDDSFGTTPETAIVAMEAFKQPKVVILGGSDKGADYGQLAEAVVGNSVRQVVAIGHTGPAITKALREKGFSHVIDGGRTMTEIVQKAKDLASPGDVVLLSTGCASFDLFKNYKDRGEQFVKAVQALA